MTINDTPKYIRDVQYDLYRRMSPAKKFRLVLDACRMGRVLAITGIRMLNPLATEEQVKQIWRKKLLGEKLYNEVYGNATPEMKIREIPKKPHL